VRATILLLLFLPLLASAAGLEDEAKRQVALCRADFDAGQFERAIAGCDSALRLDPSREIQWEAFKLKGLALEQLGQLDDARAMLMAFKSLRSGMQDDPEVEAAWARIESGRDERGVGPGLRRAAIPGLATLGGGVVLGGVGFGLGGGAWVSAQENLAAQQGLYFGARPEYEGLKTQHEVGLGLGIAGVGVAAGGAVWTIVSSLQGGPKTALLPVLDARPGRLVLGIGGELP